MVLCCPCLSASDKAALKAAFVPRKDISEEDLWLTLSQGNKPSDLSQAWFPTLDWFGRPWDYLWRRRQSNGCCSQSISSLGKGKVVCPADTLLSESTPWEEIAKGLGGHLTWILVSFLPGAMKNDNHTVVFLLRPAFRASVEASLGIICSERPGFLQLDHKRVGRCTGHYMFIFPFEGMASPSSGIQRALLRLWVGIRLHWLALRQVLHWTTKGESSSCLEQHLTYGPL